MNYKYFDTAASTKPSEAVIQTLNKSLEIYGNPSSIHNEGELASKLIYDATKIISEKINCEYSEIYYTSGASMSNSIFIQGFLRKHPDAKLVISAIEHNDIIEMANYLQDVYYVPVHSNGILDIEYLRSLLNELDGDTVLCSIQMANGECGVIQDIYAISNIIHSHSNMYLHTDATQYVPHFPIDVKYMGIDAFSMSGQKINCIKGIGLLYIKDSVKIDPIVFGEQGLIGGTENVSGIACLGTAFKELSYDNEDIYCKRDYFINSLNRENIIGDLNHRLPNNVYIKSTIDGESMVIFLNEFGICCSAGSACSFNGNKPSHVVLAMGYSESEANSCVRFTIDKNTSYEDIDYVVDIFRKLEGRD